MAHGLGGLDDAIVFFPFSETSGDAAGDVAGGRTGLLRGGASLAAPGKVGSGLALPGAGSFVEIAHDAGDALASGTLAFWVRPEAIGAAQGLVSKDAIGAGAGEMTVLLRADGRVSFRLETETKTFYAQSQRALDAGDWAHVAVSWGADGMRLHLDGALDGAASHTGGLLGAAEPWVIGADASGAGLRSHFRGGIDEVVLWGPDGAPPPAPEPTGPEPTGSEPKARTRPRPSGPRPGGRTWRPGGAAAELRRPERPRQDGRSRPGISGPTRRG